MNSATIMLCLFVAAAPQPAADCPDTKQGETTADCPWAGIARKLTLLAAQGHDVGPLVDALLPELATQMKRDRKLESLHALWGRSRNRDENSGGIIVEPATLAELAARLGVHFEGEVVHSGVQHTYAYLLSIERTPYGFKRRRWVSGTIGNGLGLPEGLLGPAPSEGTLYINATYVLARIGLRDHAPTQKTLQRLTGVPKALRDFDFSSLQITRLEERVAVGKADPMVFRSDLVLMPKAIGRLTHLLVYSAQLGRRGGPRLLSAFPVEASYAASVLDSNQTGPSRPIRPRYNSHIPSWPGTQMRTGFRRVIAP